LQSVLRRAQYNILAVQPDAAFVGTMHACEHLDAGALASTSPARNSKSA
jgi:hypothetical protein